MARAGPINYLCVACGTASALTWLLTLLTAIIVSFGLFFLLVSVFGLVQSAQSEGTQAPAIKWRAMAERGAFGEKGKINIVMDKIEKRCLDSLKDSHLLPAKFKGSSDCKLDTEAMTAPDGTPYENAKRIVDHWGRSLRAHHGSDTEIPRFDEQNIQRLSQVVAAYKETVILASEELRQCSNATGLRSQLEHIILTFPDEWDNLWSKLKRGPPEPVEAPAPLSPTRNVSVASSSSARTLPKDEDVLNTKEALKEAFLRNQIENTGIEREICLWASYRAQTVSRTIRGAVAYHQALELLLFPDEEAGVNCERLEEHVELVLAYQTYGLGDTTTDGDLEALLTTYKGYPIRIAHDFDPSKSSEVVKGRVRDYLGIKDDKFNCEWATCVSRYVSKLKWVEAGASRPEGEELKLHPSHPLVKALEKNAVVDFTLEQWRKFKIEELRADHFVKAGNKYFQQKAPGVEVVAFLPRIYPLVLGEPCGKKTQGKAANQLNALRVASGHILQVLDANMCAPCQSRRLASSRHHAPSGPHATHVCRPDATSFAPLEHATL